MKLAHANGVVWGYGRSHAAAMTMAYTETAAHNRREVRPVLAVTECVCKWCGMHVWMPSVDRIVLLPVRADGSTTAHRATCREVKGG